MVDAETSPDARGVGYIARALAAGSGATAGLLAAGVTGSAIGAAGSQLAVDAVDDLIGVIRERRHARAGVPLVMAADDLGRPLEDVLSRLAGHPEYDQLTAACVSAAAGSMLDAKLTSLANCLSNALNDEARIDHEWVIADALAVIEAPHLRLMEMLNESYMDDHDRPSLSSLMMRYPEAGAGVRPLLSALGTKAVVVDTPLFRTDYASDRVSARYFQLTEFGREILVRIHKAAGEEDWEERDNTTRSHLQRERTEALLASRQKSDERWKQTSRRRTRLAGLFVRDWIDARVWRGYGNDRE